MNINKESFLNACKQGITLQNLDGLNMSSMEIDGIIYCPWCGNKMKSKKIDGSWVQICDCITAQKTNGTLNKLIIEIDALMLQVKDIHSQVQEAALKRYKQYYIDSIYPQLQAELETEKQAILEVDSLN